MNTPRTPRLVAALASVAITFSLLSAVGGMAKAPVAGSLFGPAVVTVALR